MKNTYEFKNLRPSQVSFLLFTARVDLYEECVNE